VPAPDSAASGATPDHDVTLKTIRRHMSQADAWFRQRCSAEEKNPQHPIAELMPAMAGRKPVELLVVIATTMAARREQGRILLIDNPRFQS